MLTEIQRTSDQVSAPRVWDFATAKAQVGDYIRVPFVPVMCVVDRDMLQDGQVWLLVKRSNASHTEEWVFKPEAEQPPAPQPEPQMQPSGFSGDSVACQLRTLEFALQPAAPETQPTPDALVESEQGRIHGQHDAAARLHPIYTPAERCLRCWVYVGVQQLSS